MNSDRPAAALREAILRVDLRLADIDADYRAAAAHAPYDPDSHHAAVHALRDSRNRLEARLSLVR
jgi:hypothetical protein